MSEDLIFVQDLIHEIRGKRVMLDFDLAKLYHVETRSLNQAVKRNLKRFPPDFMFQLTVQEWKNMSSQFVMTSSRPISAPPFAFTEQGVAMMSGLLKSDVAIEANIAIMRAFVRVREYLMTASSVSAELKDLKTRVDLLAAQQEDYMKAVNDLSEDVSKDIDNLYLAIGELAKKLEEKKKAPMPRIGYKTKKL
ncbi:MAG: ORF6N domain-containing protein [Bacteroidales bacterium]|nr:ORF6N domain-containing protein [Bacteroidales bacterium]